jgi:hypothetical protein
VENKNAFGNALRILYLISHDYHQNRLVVDENDDLSVVDNSSTAVAANKVRGRRLTTMITTRRLKKAKYTQY